LWKSLLGSNERIWLIHRALVAELVDAQDLKSCLPKGEYGFDSRLGHLVFIRIGRSQFCGLFFIEDADCT
jgi:hypothetical protein